MGCIKPLIAFLHHVALKFFLQRLFRPPEIPLLCFTTLYDLFETLSSSHKHFSVLWLGNEAVINRGECAVGVVEVSVSSLP